MNKKTENNIRTCIVSGQSLDKTALIRFVIAPDGQLTPDIHQKLPGKGIWVSADRASLEKAVSKHLFQKKTKEKINIDQNIIDSIESITLNKIISTLGMARKSGNSVAGEQKVIELQTTYPEALVIIAKEASARQRQKVKNPERAAIEDILSATQLGHIFGREEVMYCAIKPGKIAKNLLIDLKRYKGLING